MALKNLARFSSTIFHTTYLDEQRAGQRKTHAPTSTKRLCGPRLISLAESETSQQRSRPSRSALSLHLRKTSVNLGEPCLLLLSGVLEALVVAFALKLLQLSVKSRFFPEQSVSPDISFEDRVEGGSVVADDLVVPVKIRTTQESESLTSCSTNRIVMCDGMGTSRMAICRSKVDFPTPLRPIRPYRRP